MRGTQPGSSGLGSTLCTIPACRNAEDARRAAQAQVASQGYRSKTEAPPSSGNGRAAALLPGAAGRQRRPAVPHTHRCGCRTPSDGTWCAGPAPSAITTPWPRRAVRGFYRLPRTPCPSPRPEEGVGSAGGGGGRLRSGAERERSAYNPRSSRRGAASGPAGRQTARSARGGGQEAAVSRTASRPHRITRAPGRAAPRGAATLGWGSGGGARRVRSSASGGERGARAACRCCALLGAVGTAPCAGHGRAGPAECGGCGIVPRGCRFWKGLAGIWRRRSKRLAGGAAVAFKKEEDAPGSYLRVCFPDRSQRRRQVERCSRSLTL